jgi:hypothetical protein
MAPPESLTVKRLAVVDDKGTERVVIAALFRIRSSWESV